MKDHRMILSIIFVHSRPAGPASGTDLSRFTKFVLDHWREQACGEPLVTYTFAVSQTAYDSLRRVGLSEKSTQRITEAMLATIGEEQLEASINECRALGDAHGVQGFRFNVTELDHPSGFPFLAIGFVAGPSETLHTTVSSQRCLPVNADSAGGETRRARRTIIWATMASVGAGVLLTIGVVFLRSNTKPTSRPGEQEASQPIGQANRTTAAEVKAPRQPSFGGAQTKPADLVPKLTVQPKAAPVRTANGALDYGNIPAPKVGTAKEPTARPEYRI
jgi:hypothetical protein